MQSLIDKEKELVEEFRKGITEYSNEQLGDIAMALGAIMQELEVLHGEYFEHFSG